MLVEISPTEKDTYALTYMWNLRRQDSQEQQRQQWLLRIRGGGNGDLLFSECKASDTQDVCILEIHHRSFCL